LAAFINFDFVGSVKCTPKNLENCGSGHGKKFPALSKECPAFAAEFAAAGLRNVRTHWGPINRKKAEGPRRQRRDVQEGAGRRRSVTPLQAAVK